MAWGPTDCGPDGLTPDGAPCVPETNTPPAQTPPPATGGGATGECPQGAGWTFNPAAGTCFPTGYGTPNEGGGGYGDFQMPDWQPFKYNFNFGDAPGFTARRFAAPNPEDILNDPSYKWRLGQSIGSLENSAAARGNLRSGNTWKGITDYAGNAASQEYGNAFDRALKVYGTDYQADRDEYMPRLLTWQTNAQAQQRAMELQAADLWKKYLADLDWSKFLLGEHG